MNKTLLSIFNSAWLIDDQWVQAQLPNIINIISGNSAANLFKAEAKDFSFPKIYNYDSKELLGAVQAGNNGVNFSNAPEGSVAIIPIHGPVMKYDDGCGGMGATTIASWVKAAGASENILAIIFDFDTPGGQAAGTATVADAIKNVKKNTIAYINDGMAASAGIWMASACDKIYVSQQTDRLGSIGVFTTLINSNGALEAEGYKLLEIYAPQSSEKNIEYREAFNGNDTRIKDDLRFIADQFISAVKVNRGDKLDLSKGDPFKGALYFADEAIAIGLADGYRTFDEILNELQNSNSSHNSNYSQKKSHNMSLKFFGSKFPSLEKLANKKEEETTAEEIDAANVELSKEGIKDLQLAPIEAIKEAETVANKLAVMNEKIKSAGFENLDSLIASQKEWEEKAIKYGAESGDEITRPNAKAEGLSKPSIDSWDDENLSFNKTIDRGRAGSRLN